MSNQDFPADPDTVVPLPMTGERTAPDTDQENYWFRRHEIVYLAWREHCRGRDIIEAGAGEGYGAGILAPYAQSLHGMDYDLLACQHAASKYGVGAPCPLTFTQADLGALPLADECTDVIVNSQVIEHLPDQEAFVAECFRVLRPGGVFLVATPNRITFTPTGQPINPFHIRELNARELADLLVEPGFELVETLGVYHGPHLRSLDNKWGGLIHAQLQPYLENRSWPAELRTDVDSITAIDFEFRSCPPTEVELGKLDDPTSLDDSLDLVFVGRKPR